MARLHGAWTRGIARLAGGEEELVEFLESRAVAHGGESKLTGKVARILHKRGKVSSVILDGDEQPTGVAFLVTDMTARALTDLLPDYEPSRRALASLPVLAPAEHRFVVSMVVRDAGIPAPLGEESFLLPSCPRTGDRARGPPCTFSD